MKTQKKVNKNDGDNELTINIKIKVDRDLKHYKVINEDSDSDS